MIHYKCVINTGIKSVNAKNKKAYDTNQKFKILILQFLVLNLYLPNFN